MGPLIVQLWYIQHRQSTPSLVLYSKLSPEVTTATALFMVNVTKILGNRAPFLHGTVTCELNLETKCIIVINQIEWELKSTHFELPRTVYVVCLNCKRFNNNDDEILGRLRGKNFCHAIVEN